VVSGRHLAIGDRLMEQRGQPKTGGRGLSKERGVVTTNPRKGAWLPRGLGNQLALVAEPEIALRVMRWVRDDHEVGQPWRPRRQARRIKVRPDIAVNHPERLLTEPVQSAAYAAARLKSRRTLIRIPHGYSPRAAIADMGVDLLG